MFAYAVASAALIAVSSSAFAGNSTRGAFAAIDARQAQQDQRQAYALTGEQTRMQRQDHAAVTRAIDGGRNAH
jgi:ABC-type arginine transport system permease subunit